MNSYRVFINPIPKPRMVRSDKWQKRACVIRYWDYKDNLNEKLRNVGLFELPPAFNVEFGLAMPKSWGRNKKLKMNGEPHQQTPDLDNLLKGLFDSLMVQDKQIYSVCSSKFWAQEGYILVEIDNDF